MEGYALIGSWRENISRKQKQTGLEGPSVRTLGSLLSDNDPTVQCEIVERQSCTKVPVTVQICPSSKIMSWYSLHQMILAKIHFSLESKTAPSLGTGNASRCNLPMGMPFMSYTHYLESTMFTAILKVIGKKKQFICLC